MYVRGMFPSSTGKPGEVAIGLKHVKQDLVYTLYLKPTAYGEFLKSRMKICMIDLKNILWYLECIMNALYPQII